MMRIYYKGGSKYHLVQKYNILLDFRPPHPIGTWFIHLSNSGLLEIKAGYPWDGPSGPTFDTKSFMRASLVHDALYELMRQGLLDIEFREAADRELRRICREDGMSRIRAWYVYRSVRLFAGGSASTSNRKEVIEAP